MPTNSNSVAESQQFQVALNISDGVYNYVSDGVYNYVSDGVYNYVSSFNEGKGSIE